MSTSGPTQASIGLVVFRPQKGQIKSDPDSGYVFKPITFPSLPKLQNKKNQSGGKRKENQKTPNPQKCLEDASD